MARRNGTGDRSSSLISDEVVKKRESLDQSTRTLGMEPEDVKVDDPLIREYVAQRSAELTDGTIRTYLTAFRHYVEYLDKLADEDTDVLTAAIEDIHGFFIHCAEDLQHSENTVSNRKKALKGFYDYLQLHENPELSSAHIDKAFTKEVRRLCSEGYDREPISRDELGLLYDNAGSQTKRLIIRFTYETGARNSDVCDLKLVNVDLDKKRVTFKNSKGGKDYSVPIRDELAIRLRQWIHSGRESMLDDRESEYLFPGPQSEKMRRRYLCKIVKSAAEAAGIQDVIGVDNRPWGKVEISRVTPHTLRHSVITHLANDNVDLKYRQLLAGHSKASTTENIYTHDDETAFDILRNELN